MPASSRDAIRRRHDGRDITLTRREMDVLWLLCHRLTDAEIAHRLCISVRTAESHVAHILDKVQAANRREAAAAAIDLGLVSRPGAAFVARFEPSHPKRAPPGVRPLYRWRPTPSGMSGFAP